jgi:hypothetical protein
LKETFHDVGSALVLMNKLLEDKRYDDASNLFDFACQRGFTSTTNRKYPSDVVTLAIEAYYRQVKHDDNLSMICIIRMTYICRIRHNR